MPPKDPECEWDGCCGGGAGLEAYRDKMDCFKSGRDCTPGVAAALEGRFGGGAESPKKSRPSRESAGFVCLGGAASAFARGLLKGGPAVLDLGEELLSSPNRSGCCVLLTCEAPPGVGLFIDVAALCDDDRSMLCFSFTKLSGTSSSPSASKVEGSGIGPSMVHRFDSYLVRMKFSIFASEGTCPGANLSSQYLFALEFPHFNTL